VEKITMRQLRDLDEKYGQEVVIFLRHVVRETINHDDNVSALRQMAETRNVPPAELSTLVRAKLYAKERGTSCEPTTSPKLMAEHICSEKHIDDVLEEFFAWLEEQAEIFERDRQATAGEPDAATCGERRPELNSAEWQDYLDDLREEAGRGCD